MRKSKDLSLIAVICGLFVASMILVLILIFRPVEGEEEIYWELYSRDWQTYFTQAELQQIREISREEAEKVNKDKENAQSRQYPPPLKDIKLSKERFTAEEIEINTLIYQIAQQALFNTSVKHLSLYSDIDPLMILALSNVENGGIRGNNFKLLGSAIPGEYLHVSQITPEYLKSFNFNEAIKLDIKMAFNWDNCNYIGPLQMSLGYGGIGSTQSRFKSLLLYPEGERKIVATDTSILEMVNSRGYAQYVSGEPGDRWNWNDACVRSVASWDAGFALLSSDKKSMITDKYMLATIVSLNHNVGVSVCALSFDTLSEGFIKYIPGDGAKIKDIWLFSQWLTRPELVTEISALAESYLAKGDIYHLPTKSEMNDLINRYGHLMDQGTFKMMQPYKGWETEPPMHGLRTLYNYILLEKLYSGR